MLLFLVSAECVCVCGPYLSLLLSEQEEGGHCQSRTSSAHTSLSPYRSPFTFLSCAMITESNTLNVPSGRKSVLYGSFQFSPWGDVTLYMAVVLVCGHMNELFASILHSAVSHQTGNVNEIFYNPPWFVNSLWFRTYQLSFVVFCAQKQNKEKTLSFYVAVTSFSFSSWWVTEFRWLTMHVHVRMCPELSNFPTIVFKEQLVKKVICSKLVQ